jgi:hypothetical protein
MGTIWQNSSRAMELFEKGYRRAGRGQNFGNAEAAEPVEMIGKKEGLSGFGEGGYRLQTSTDSRVLWCQTNLVTNLEWGIAWDGH